MKITGQSYSSIEMLERERKKQHNFESWEINEQVSRLKKLNPELTVQKTKRQINLHCMTHKEHRYC